MRLRPAAPSRILAVVRHASLAAGFALGWILLSSSGASASDDLLGSLPLPTAPVSAPATLVTTPVDLPGVPAVQQTIASAVGSTTSTLVSGVQAAPSLVAPVLTGPLEPAAPVVDQTASGAAATVGSVGGTAASVVSDPASVPGLLTSPIQPPATPPTQQPASPDTVAPATEESAAADPGIHPPAVPSVDADRAKVVSPVRVPGWSLFALASTAAGTHAGALLAPSPAPDDPLPAPLPAAPPSGGTGGAPDGSRGPSPPAEALAGFELVSPLLVFEGQRAHRDPAPPSRTFDPGSTPD